MEYRKLRELKLLEKNPRKISVADMDILKKSITDNPDYFEARPIIVSDRTGELIIIAGNQRYRAAKELKLTKVPVHILKGLSEAREREIIIRDNVSNGEWDYDMLREWDVTELQNWGVDLPGFEPISDDNELYINKIKAPTYEPKNEKPPIVKIRLMTTRHRRLHHFVIWKNTVPKILNEQFKKY